MLPGNPLGDLGLPVPVSNNEGRIESYKAFIEKASQPRRQGAYKHSNPVLQQDTGDSILKGHGLG